MFESLYQSFDANPQSALSAERIAALRRALRRKGVDGFIAPRADEHQNEYVPACGERLAWLTGFTGSAGLAIVLRDKLALFVDGRYTIQAAQQVDAKFVAVTPMASATPEAWLGANLRKGDRIGYDPWLHTPAQIESFERAAKSAGARLTPLSSNPIDAVWRDRPSSPCGPIRIHPPRFAGEQTRSKLKRIVKALGGADALLISDPHAMAWAFNIRGSDVAYTPLPIGWALVKKTGKPILYIADAKLSTSVRKKLAATARLCEPSELTNHLAQLGARRSTVLFDRATAPIRLVRAVENAGGQARVESDPVALMKAVKNAVELAGARAAHLRDGAALTRFLAWFAETAPKGALTEIAAASAPEDFRRQTGQLKDLSFPTISAFGPNGALPHYRVTRDSDRRIGQGLYLVDSGAQYEDGTTDVTRTVVVGPPSGAMRDRFTRVLKGHIAIATAVFPDGTSGAQIDAFARRALWECGLDFDHGTGHGVGSYLSVHEGPQRISKLGSTSLAPGMIVSNEPAYYKPGKWGVRIENLLIVESREIKGAERKTYGFETLTLAPLDRELIDASLLRADETAWIDAYHAWVRKALSPLLDSKTRRWLTEVARPLRQ